MEGSNLIFLADHRLRGEQVKKGLWSDPVLRRMNQMLTRSQNAYSEGILSRSEKLTMQDLIEQIKALYYEAQSIEKYLLELDSDL